MTEEPGSHGVGGERKTPGVFGQNRECAIAEGVTPCLRKDLTKAPAHGQNYRGKKEVERPVQRMMYWEGRVGEDGGGMERFGASPYP